MWRRVPCEQQLNMGQSVLRDQRKLFQKAYIKSKIDANLTRKGIGLIFPNLDTERDSSESNAVTQTNSETSARTLGRVVFSL